MWLVFITEIDCGLREVWTEVQEATDGTNISKMYGAMQKKISLLSTEQEIRCPDVYEISTWIRQNQRLEKQLTTYTYHPFQNTK